MDWGAAASSGSAPAYPNGGQAAPSMSAAPLGRERVAEALEASASSATARLLAMKLNGAVQDLQRLEETVSAGVRLTSSAASSSEADRSEVSGLKAMMGNLLEAVGQLSACMNTCEVQSGGAPSLLGVNLAQASSPPSHQGPDVHRRRSTDGDLWATLEQQQQAQSTAAALSAVDNYKAMVQKNWSHASDTCRQSQAMVESMARAHNASQQSQANGAQPPRGADAPPTRSPGVDLLPTLDHLYSMTRALSEQLPPLPQPPGAERGAGGAGLDSSFLSRPTSSSEAFQMLMQAQSPQDTEMMRSNLESPSSRGHRPRPPYASVAMRAIDNLIHIVAGLTTRMDVCDRTLDSIKQDILRSVYSNQRMTQQPEPWQSTSQDLERHVSSYSKPEAGLTYQSLVGRLDTLVEKLHNCETRAENYAYNLTRINAAVKAMTAKMAPDDHAMIAMLAAIMPSIDLSGDDATDMESPISQLIDPSFTARPALSSEAMRRELAEPLAPSSPLPSGRRRSQPAVSMSLKFNGPQWSEGSSKHPLRCTPCNFFCFSSRGCNRGDACQFCHQMHVSKAQIRMEFLTQPGWASGRTTTAGTTTAGTPSQLGPRGRRQEDSDSGFGQPAPRSRGPIGGGASAASSRRSASERA